MPKKGIKLGDEIIDVTSKTVGVAIARVEYLSGAIYWIMQPYTTDDNMPVRTYEVHDAYVKWNGEGVYPTHKREIGFHARNDGK